MDAKNNKKAACRAIVGKEYINFCAL